MEVGDLLGIVFATLFFGSIFITIAAAVRERRNVRANAARSEALFVSMFTELQPHLHPKNVIEYVLARVQRGKAFKATEWSNPPGFPAARLAQLQSTPKGERTLLKDAAGNTLAEFLFDYGDKPPTAGIARVGAGKFRVKKEAGRQWATYWHPEREFKWKGPGQWTFTTRVADRPIESSDRGTSWSDSSSSSSSSSHAPAIAATAAAAGIVAAGGTFDGGGAAAAWDAQGGDGPRGDDSSRGPAY